MITGALQTGVNRVIIQHDNGHCRQVRIGLLYSMITGALQTGANRVIIQHDNGHCGQV